VPTCDYLFTKLEPHQQNRIRIFVGMVDDPQNVGYNVNQSEIAIGSGGIFGKGFLQGTQTRYNFVPEKHTDFIFCVVGEEWGFLGCFVVVALYVALILRLMRMGERIKEPFGRVYCYSVAAMLLLHVCVNIGMTIGLMPVMGIPLPLMSYGGSSLLAFSLLIMIAIRLDASTSDNDMNMGV
jgi:rod shape determining protein RodA